MAICPGGLGCRHFHEPFLESCKYLKDADRGWDFMNMRPFVHVNERLLGAAERVAKRGSRHSMPASSVAPADYGAGAAIAQPDEGFVCAGRAG